MSLGAGVVEGREDGISNIFDHLFFFFYKNSDVYHKEFKSFWVIEVSF